MKKKAHIYIILLICLAALAGCVTREYHPCTPAVPKNIILMIGDGMGTAQLTAGRIVNKKLEMERMPVGGLLTTHCSDRLITDSAASATALATGSKALFHTVSVSPENKPLKTVLEYAAEKKKGAGIVAACSVTHATPACFMAHNKDRTNSLEIAESIANSKVDVLFGGGWQKFVPANEFEHGRPDNKNLLEQMAKRMTVIKTKDEFDNLGDVERVVGLFSPRHLGDARVRDPSLEEMAEKAIKILSKNQNGFFLMVEGSQIDWRCHKNSTNEVAVEVIDFDKAVGVALDFAETDRDTLVIVTADHETGGFAVTNGSISEATYTGAFSSHGHTATMVPLLAYGPGSEVFGGIHDNTFIGRKLIEYVTDQPASCMKRCMRLGQ